MQGSLKYIRIFVDNGTNFGYLRVVDMPDFSTFFVKLSLSLRYVKNDRPYLDENGFTSICKFFFYFDLHVRWAFKS